MTKNDSRFLALLRGINVGGKNIIAKADLRQCFEELGLTNVRTYIQSGNVLFRCDEKSVDELTATLQAGSIRLQGASRRPVTTEIQVSGRRRTKRLGH